MEFRLILIREGGIRLDPLLNLRRLRFLGTLVIQLLLLCMQRCLRRRHKLCCRPVGITQRLPLCTDVDVRRLAEGIGDGAVRTAAAHGRNCIAREKRTRPRILYNLHK